jgi:hypothetical protein
MDPRYQLPPVVPDFPLLSHQLPLLGLPPVVPSASPCCSGPSFCSARAGQMPLPVDPLEVHNGSKKPQDHLYRHHRLHESSAGDRGGEPVYDGARWLCARGCGFASFSFHEMEEHEAIPCRTQRHGTASLSAQLGFTKSSERREFARGTNTTEYRPAALAPLQPFGFSVTEQRQFNQGIPLDLKARLDRVLTESKALDPIGLSRHSRRMPSVKQYSPHAAGNQSSSFNIRTWDRHRSKESNSEALQFDVSQSPPRCETYPHPHPHPHPHTSTHTRIYTRQAAPSQQERP